jgi:hypothetical protein
VKAAIQTLWVAALSFRRTGKPKMRKSEREAVTAYHEAGHAVIARQLGLEVASVTIIPDLDYFGVTYYHHFATYLARNADLATQISAAETDAMVSLAGPTAECLYRRPSKREMAVCWETDREAVIDAVSRAVDFKHDLLTGHGPECDGELFDQLCDEFDQLCDELNNQLSLKTMMLVVKHWPAIERVAHGLRNFSSLDQTDVDDLIAGTFPNRFAAMRRFSFPQGAVLPR